MTELVKHEEKTNSLMDTISRAASDPNTDVEKLERLMDMYERITSREGEVEFNKSMTRAQSLVGRVHADMENKQTRSTYASYAGLDKILRPIYTKEGFALSFDTGDCPINGYVRVLGYVSHKDGFTRTYKVDMPADGKGAKGGDVMTKTHASGAAMSYGMRYLLKMIFNIAVGEDDVDGNEPIQLASPKEVSALKIAIKVAEDATKEPQFEKFLEYAGVEKLEDIPAAHFDKLLTALKRKAQ